MIRLWRRQEDRCGKPQYRPATAHPTLEPCHPFDAGGYMRALSKDTKNKDSGAPSYFVVDEYHAHPTSDIYDIGFNSFGKRPQALMDVITTAGDDVQSKPCYREESYAKQVLDGDAVDETYFVMICELDEGDNPHDKALWSKPNPCLRYPNEYSDYLLEQIETEYTAAYGSNDPHKIRQFLTRRNTLWDELEKVGWDAAKLKTACETDCSAFMTACARAAGVDIPRVAMGNGQYNAPVTYTMRSAFGSTGKFQVLTDAKYLTSDKYLKRGDVLVRESGHTAMALGNGAQADTPTQAASVPTAAAPAAALKEVKATGIAFYRDNAFAGAYKCTASTFLSVRDAAGTRNKELMHLRPGEVVDCYGYYSTADGVKWLYITFVQDGVRYTAFACANYLRKL